MRKHLKLYLVFLFWLFIMSVFWSIAFLLTNYIYSHFEIGLNDWLKQLITSALGLILLFASVYFVTHLYKKMGKHQEREKFFQSITTAMNQIATGDFNVNLVKIKGHDNPNDPFGNIVDNINYMAKELGKVEEMRQEFISNVSHEIQSPLTSISGFARALKNEQLTSAERFRYLGIIETESKRLSNISDNLLKLTYLEADQHGFSPKKYRLDQQLQRIILACEVQWRDKQIDMRLQVKETYITADEELLNQVWLNLINNAIKFTGEQGKITVQILKEPEKTTVVIADTGIGISEEEKLHLFERFYKADKARNRDASGSGLGLSIVKKILHLHDAAIQVDSSETGTTFHVSFTNDAGL